MPSHTPLAEKYRPNSYKEIIGQQEAIREIERFMQEFPQALKSIPRTKKALILHGPAGTGKTTIVHCLAKEHDLDIFELNSSDLRNRLKLEEVLKPASKQQSLFKRGKILLMDEVDGVTGTDRGGVPELIRIIQKSAHPIIMTGNDVWDSKFSQLRQKCKLVELRALPTETVVSVLNKVLQSEKIEENSHFIRQIALKSQGDLRAALNDLQSFAVDKEDPDFLSERNKQDNIFNILKILFQERSDFLNLFDSTKMSLDEILLWIEENIPKEYSGKELANAYQALARADTFRGRIYRQQFWRFLVYQNIFQSAGISYAKNQEKTGFKKYDRPKRILKIWLNNQKTAKKKTIAQKYAKFVHCSTKRAMRDFKTIKLILNSSPTIQNNIKLNQDEIDFLSK
jgi:replication factor C large subunit